MNDEVIDEDLETEDLDEEDLDEEDFDDDIVEVRPRNDADVVETGRPGRDRRGQTPRKQTRCRLARKRPGSDDDEEDDVDLDDVEADLDRILKDKIASSEDDEDEEDEPEPVGDPGDRVAAKGVDEFTCNTCFLIVHPRQFGRAGNLGCPEGYDPCPSIKKVASILKREAGVRRT